MQLKPPCDKFPLSRDHHAVCHLTPDFSSQWKAAGICVRSFKSMSSGMVHLRSAYRPCCSHTTCGQRATWDHSTGLVMSKDKLTTDQPPNSHTCLSKGEINISVWFSHFCLAFVLFPTVVWDRYVHNYLKLHIIFSRLAGCFTISVK